MSDEIIQVESMDSSKKNSRVVISMGEEETVEFGSEKNQCYWNDGEFPEGSKVCDNGTIYECELGCWFKRDGTC